MFPIKFILKNKRINNMLSLSLSEIKKQETKIFIIKMPDLSSSWHIFDKFQLLDRFQLNFLNIKNYDPQKKHLLKTLIFNHDKEEMVLDLL